MAVRVERLKRGARLVEKDCVLSEVLSQPGATNCLFDVLAMCIASQAPGPRVGVLGFAGGGIVAPLRAAGWHHPLRAVDLTLAGERLFRELCGSWSGPVKVVRSDAAAWLDAEPDESFDLLFEDLSVARGREISKPEVSLETLPRLMRRKVAPAGVVVTNVLPVAGWSYPRLLTLLAQPWPRAVVVSFDQWENRVLLTGRKLSSAREISRALRSALVAIGSDQASRMKVRTFRG